MDVIVERCAGLDVHKDTVLACVRGPGCRRVTLGASARVPYLDERAAGVAWLADAGVTQVAMEATGV